MQAVVDSKKKNYFRCLLENGDLITVNSSDMGENIAVGDIVNIEITKNTAASARQKELMQ